MGSPSFRASPVPPLQQTYGGPFGEGMERWAGTPKPLAMEGEELDVLKELQDEANKIVELHQKMQVEAARKRRAAETWQEEQRMLTAAMSSSYSANYGDHSTGSDEEDLLAYCPSDEMAVEATTSADGYSGCNMIEGMQCDVSLTFRSASEEGCG